MNPGTFVNPPFGRLLTAMVTPFAQDGSVDEKQVAHLAEYLIDNGHDGLIVCGTTGEYSTMTDDENERVFAIVKEAVGDRASIVAGVGSNDTAHTIELARRAEKVGVDGLLVVTPYYNKPTQHGVYAHFSTVAKATSTPIMLYDIPGRASIPIAPTPTVGWQNLIILLLLRMRRLTLAPQPTLWQPQICITTVVMMV